VANNDSPTLRFFCI